jgi:hypothetical protein
MANSIDAALLEARDPGASPERLRQLSKWTHPEERIRLCQAIASNPNAEDALLWKLAAEHPDQVVSNPRFQLRRLSAEPWWHECDSSALIQLIAILGNSVPEAARTHLVKLIWAELTDSPISINLEAHQAESADIYCDLPATREGLVDLLSFLGVFEEHEGTSLGIKKWSGSPLGTATLVLKTEWSGSTKTDYSIKVESSIASFTTKISSEDGRWKCESLDLQTWDSCWDPEDYETPEDREVLELELLEELFHGIEKPRFSVLLSCVVEENCADLTPTGHGKPQDAAELLSVIKSLGIEDGASIDLQELPCFDYEIDCIPGGQGYWGIDAVTPNPQGWSFDESLDGFGAGSITATGPSGNSYETEVQEPGQNQEFKNATLCESLGMRLCSGHFGGSELSSLLAKVFR